MLCHAVICSIVFRVTKHEYRMGVAGVRRKVLAVLLKNKNPTLRMWGIRVKLDRALEI